MASPYKTPQKQQKTESPFKTPLEPLEPFSSGREAKLGKVLYRYPKGITTSYGVEFSPKEPTKPIPIFNQNTYQRQAYPHHLDAKTTKEVFLLGYFGNFYREILRK